VPSSTTKTEALRAAERSGLIRAGEPLLVMLSGGADSVCLLDVSLRLGARVSALHVNYGLRPEADGDEAHCRALCSRLGIDLHVERVSLPESGNLQARARDARYALAERHAAADYAAAHTATDQAETVLYRLVASGAAGGIKPRREDGVVRPLLTVWREETKAYCRAEGLEYRTDASNRETKRGLIREEILPRLRQLHPAAEQNLLRLAEGKPSALDELLASTAGSKRLDLGGGLTVVREYERVWVERTPVSLETEVVWGEWRIASELPGLKVRAWRAGDRLAGRAKKIQDVFVDAKIPRSDRESWPLVVRGDEVVAVPGIVEAEGVRVERVGSH
jgi:tRNA(Ile)-lysidine synthase